MNSYYAIIGGNEFILYGGDPIEALGVCPYDLADFEKIELIRAGIASLADLENFFKKRELQ